MRSLSQISKAMKKILLVCTGLFALTLNAQEEDPIVRISEVQLLLSTDYSNTPFGTIADMQKISPQSSILQQDFSGYSANNYNVIFSQNSFNMLLGLSFRDRTNMTLRAGVGYSNRTLLGLSMGQTERFAYDTLTSSLTGQQYFVDSAVNRSLFAYYNTQFLSLESSLIFRTNSEARWSLYGGVGLSLGFGFNGKTDITRYEYSTIESQVSYNYSDTYDYKSESNSVANSYFFGINAPLGVDFRIGKTREFWNRIHLAYELRPGIAVYTIPGTESRLTPFVQQALGLRVTF